MSQQKNNNVRSTPGSKERETPSKRIDDMMRIMYNQSELEVELSNNLKEMNSEDEEQIILEQVSKNGRFVKSFITNRPKTIVPRITNH